MKKNKKISIISIIIVFAFAGILQLISYTTNKDDFLPENIRITVGEVYETSSTMYSYDIDYVYVVDGTYYESGERGILKSDWQRYKKTIDSNLTVKVPIVYSVTDHKLNFFINKRLEDSLKIGTNLNASILSSNTIENRLKYKTIQSAYTKQKYLKEYFEFKKLQSVK